MDENLKREALTTISLTIFNLKNIIHEEGRVRGGRRDEMRTTFEPEPSDLS